MSLYPPPLRFQPTSSRRSQVEQPGKLLRSLSYQLTALESGQGDDNAVYWQATAITNDLRSISHLINVDAELERAQSLLSGMKSGPSTADVASPRSRTSAFRSILAADLDSDPEVEDYDSDADSVLTDLDASPPAPTEEEEEELDEYDRAASAPPPPKLQAEESETLLQSDRATHEALSSELLRMASVLKSNSLAFADALERDRLLVEKAGDHLSGNLDLLTRTRGKLGVYSKKARSMGWFTLAAILTVITSWIFMFFIIRLT